MIKLDNVSIRFGEEPLFDDLSWTITPEPHRVGLVGPNGAGKTTLLKVIAGEQRVDAGTVTREGVSIGYLEQDVQELPDDRTVRKEALRAFEDVLALEEEEQEISEELETTDHESARHGTLLNRLQRVQEKLEVHDAHRIRPRTEATLTGLGFAPDELDQPLRTFSGGWRMRAALARLLLKQPDVLLLDEPTNHLDIASIDWLEDTLETYPGAVILVSHDRSVLDRMVTSIAELVRGRLLHYDGNYSHYLEAREARYERWRRKYENQQKRIEEIKTFISKFRYNAARASQVQSRIKKLEKMDRIPPPPDSAPAMAFEFPEPPRAGVVVLELSAFSKTYDSEQGTETVFTDAGPLTIERGDKIALVGPNGAGKSTLARILGGMEDFEGTRTEGHNVNFSFHAQHQAEMLDPNQTVFETVREADPDRPATELRSLLGRFLFTDDDAFKEVRVLSGGEKSRLSLARTLLSPANLLILDEPTNHLDIQSREVLIEALQKYEGTFILVSHDRYVLDAVAEKTWRVGGGTVRTFLGNYSEFRWQVEEGSARPLQDTQDAGVTDPPTDPPTNGHASTDTLEPEPADDDTTDPDGTDSSRVQAREDGPFADLNSYQLKQKLEETEERILDMEERQEELEAAMADPEAYDGDGAAARELSDEYNSLKKELSDLYEEWEVLTEHVMALSD